VIPDSILRKPGPLTPEEFDVMRTHTTVGSEMFGTVTHSETIGMAATIARSHHERWDGSGYPDGLAGEDIPIAARIVAVADVFDALVTNRPYRDALTEEEAVAVIDAGAGAQFDPDVVEAFHRWREFRRRPKRSTGRSSLASARFVRRPLCVLRGPAGCRTPAARLGSFARPCDRPHVRCRAVGGGD